MSLEELAEAYWALDKQLDQLQAQKEALRRQIITAVEQEAGRHEAGAFEVVLSDNERITTNEAALLEALKARQLTDAIMLVEVPNEDKVLEYLANETLPRTVIDQVTTVKTWQSLRVRPVRGA